MTKRLVVIAAIVFVVAMAAMAQPQDRGAGGPAPNLSLDEQNMVRNIMSATDPAAKMKAVADFIKKYPKTSVRSQVAQTAAAQIAALKDPAQKLAFAQQYQTIFNEPAEEEMIAPVLIGAYADTNQPDEAFAKGAAFLAKHPDSLEVLVDLVSISTEQVKKQNAKFIAQAIQFGTHAIELIEADKKPAGLDDERWKAYRTATLPAVYQSMALLYLASGNRAEAKARYTKASQLAPSDPFNFVMLAGLLNQEYQNAAQHYQTMPAGQERDAELKKAQTMLDDVIDAYAHAIALSEGNAALQQVRQQYLADLQTYYKYRHNGATDGMQQ
jgi:hypothetical protein